MSQTQNTKKSRDKKIASSGIRMLELLKALAKSPLSPSELLKILEEKSDKVYRKEIVSKYINTLKLLGLDLSKVKDKYVLDKNFEKIDFNKTDLSLLKYIDKYTKSIELETLNENITETLQKLEKSFSQETYELISKGDIKTYRPRKNAVIKSKNVKLYEQYCKEALKLEITYKTDEEEKSFKIAPIKILYKKNTAVLIAYDCLNCEHKEFLLNCITSAKQTPQKNSSEFTNTVTFKLKNRLAKAYVLKNEEKVLKYGSSAKDYYIIVSNNTEDRDLLLRRLARYADQCVILYPKEYRKKMIEYVEYIEKLYE